ncbi:phospholipase D-like domain-containing protein [Leeuwenhoekiella sp. UBA6783]|uniref:phospholipase D-like domain-containing protein n=1 Tax=Leeuwenhoekiella sp. UBA6783 TaxID=1946747 RepID=UPI0025BF4B31|nr:phospholipase D-like domain-containing protein [Leeuwenhoekiella sp. UBA6783]|tara:strand:+ start:3906 stop:4529 length:624 start_codon:yes stop_codon:yes gene_type:complete
MKSHFLRPSNNEEFVNELIEFFKDEGQLLIAVAYFNSDLFAELIIERFEKKQQTLLILNTSDLIRPQNPGDSEIAISKALMKVITADTRQTYINIKTLGIRKKGKYQNMHHKFFINSKKLIFGSFNLTNAAINKNYESVISTRNINLRKDFRSEFGKLWNDGIELYSGSRYNALRTLMCPICEINDYIDFESFGPICTVCGHKFIIK